MSDTVLEFNPFLPEVHSDPYPAYAQLRELDPVHKGMFPGVWILTRYADCLLILRDPRFSSDSRKSELFELFREMVGQQSPGLLEENRARSMLFVDPPDHTRLRTLVNKAFTPRVVESLRPHMQDIVDELLTAVLEAGSGTMDVVADLAYPLPIRVICEMLGVPPEDREVFRQWSSDLVVSLDPIISVELFERANRAAEAFTDYFLGLIRDRRAHPRSDLLSGLIQAEDEGRSLTEDELISTCILLLVAGHETTVNLIGNGVLSLLRHPQEMGQLRAEPSLIRTAVEELLRYDAPVQLTGRTVLEDMEIGGRPIDKGHQVVAVLGAANRDPAQFPDPDRLDLGRNDNRHLAFGSGIHFCLGAPLARAEGQVAIATLLRRVPRIELATEEELEWRETVTLRGLKSLPVRFGG